MPISAMDEVTAALDACRRLGIPPDRVGRNLGPHRLAFFELSQHRESRNERDLRALARSLRNLARIFVLERDCRAGRHAHH